MLDAPLKEGELVEEVENGIKIIADPRLYRYTSDSIRLAKSVSVSAKGRVLDLCTGGGIVPLALAARTSAAIDGVELQYPLYDMARRSVAMNGLNERIRIINADLVGYCPEFAYDAVTCNPPYYKAESGGVRKTQTADIARHELRCTLADVIETAEKALKFGGKFYILHKCDRMSEVLTELTKRGLEPKELTIFTHGRGGADTFVAAAKKGARVGLKTTIVNI